MGKPKPDAVVTICARIADCSKAIERAAEEFDRAKARLTQLHANMEKLKKSLDARVGRQREEIDG